MRESGPSLTEIGEWRYETVHHMGRRCWNWDYTERCIYEITVVLKDRRKGWLGCLRENAQTQDQRELVSTELPEWSEGFVDVILWRDGQLQAMLDYLADNPRRLAMKRADPGLFKRVVDLQIVLKIGDASSRCREELVGHFSAIGNRFLLEAPLAQVQVSRRFCRYRRITLPSGGSKIARDAGGEPIVELETPEYRARRDELLAAARHGAVLVSPCVSDGERQIAREALSAGMKLITMLNKGFSPLQKPTGRYFDACAEGRLLMIAPCAWPYVPGEKPMTRFEATAMNRLCQWIVGDGAAYINYHGMKPENIDELAIRSVCKEEAPSWR